MYVYHDSVCIPQWSYALHRQDGVGGLELIPLIGLIVASSYHVRISAR